MERIQSDHMEVLRRTGVDRVQHDSHVPFLGHLAGVRRLLQEWGASEELVDAGLFHSVYGTEFFDPDLERGPSRDELRALIGEHAERIVWLWCNTRRASLQPNLARESDWSLEHRDGTQEPISRTELVDLVELWCADAVEQVARIKAEELDFSRGLSEVAVLASPAAQRALGAATRDD